MTFEAPVLYSEGINHPPTRRRKMTRTTTLMATGLTSLALAACGGTAASTPVASLAPTANVPSAQTVHGWPAKWCQAKAGMTVDQLTALMGRSTDDQLHSTVPAVSWDAYEYQFNAFIGVDGKVRQLDTNTARLSQSEVKQLGCATTR